MVSTETMVPLVRRIVVPVVLAGTISGCAAGPAGAPDTDPEDHPSMGGTSGAEPSLSGGSGPLTEPTGAADGGMAPTTRTPEVASKETLTMVRLSKLQWANTLRTLFPTLALENVEEEVTNDALVGFDTEAAGLYVTDQIRTDLQRVAETIAAQVSADPQLIASLFPADTAVELANTGAFIEHFGRQVYRRPLSADEVSEHVAIFNRGPELSADRPALEAGVVLTLETMLQSPHFLYRTELGSEVVDERTALLPHELAAKLAYALTNRPPDAELSVAADSNQLQDAASVRVHVERLLDTAAAQEMLAHFSFQAWRMGVYAGITRDPGLFPEFSPELPAAATQSSLQFVRSMFAQNEGLRALLTKPVAFVNSDLAPFYGVPGEFTKDTFQEVNLEATQRAGFLTQIGHLAAYAKDHEVDSIRRGVFVNDRILCRELLLPDIDIPQLPPPESAPTNRIRIETFTGVGTCGAACHGTFINPAGFAFEKYDMLGRYRETENGQPVDATGSYPFLKDGMTVDQSFDGAVDFSQLIAESERAHTCYAKTWLSYLFGRKPKANDASVFKRLGAESLTQDLSIRQLVTELAIDEQFRFRFVGVTQ